MSAFWYFLPGVSSLEFKAGNAAEVLAAAGLGYLRLRSVTTDPAAVGQDAIAVEWPDGPGGPGSAVIPMAPTPPGGELTHQPDTQTWRDCGRFWIGYDAAPTPGELQRVDVPVAGYEHTDANGGVWCVPVLSPDGCTLPTDLVFAEDSDAVTFTPKPNVAHLQTIGEKLAQAWITGEIELPVNELAEMAVTILQQHYRVSKIEFNEFHHAGVSVFDLAFAQIVTQFAVGTELLKELEKKTT